MICGHAVMRISDQSEQYVQVVQYLLLKATGLRKPTAFLYVSIVSTLSHEGTRFIISIKTVRHTYISSEYVTFLISSPSDLSA